MHLKITAWSPDPKRARKLHYRAVLGWLAATLTVSLTRASIVLNIEWVQFVLQNCEILQSVRGLYDKSSALAWYYFTSDVMYKRYKRLAYTSPDLLARFCKVNLSNAKNSAWFVFLMYCDQEPLWLCYFLGVHRCTYRLSSGCKINFSLSLDCLQIIFL